MCKHEHVTIISRLIYHATREEPAEYAEWGECNECGKRMDLTDIPDLDLSEYGTEDEPTRRMPHEHYD